VAAAVVAVALRHCPPAAAAPPHGHSPSTARAPLALLPPHAPAFPLPSPHCRIILNKTDLVGASDLAALRERIRAINAMATLQPTQRSVVPVDYVLGVGGFDLEKVEEQVGRLRCWGLLAAAGCCWGLLTGGWWAGGSWLLAAGWLLTGGGGARYGPRVWGVLHGGRGSGGSGAWQQGVLGVARLGGGWAEVARPISAGAALRQPPAAAQALRPAAVQLFQLASSPTSTAPPRPTLPPLLLKV
jgi:hypothetical protein